MGIGDGVWETEGVGGMREKKNEEVKGRKEEGMKERRREGWKG